jgi:hypothetical protein
MVRQLASNGRGRRERRLRGPAVAVAVGLIVGVSQLSAYAAEDRVLSRSTAIARPDVLLTPKGAPPKLNFNFGETQAWLRSDGQWQMEGWIHHRALLCATYRVGLRFGTGHPGCTDVQWVSEPVFVTRELQCNGATVQHAAGESDPELARAFRRITCAERVVRCSGTCK